MRRSMRIFKNLHGNYKKLIANNISMKKDIESINNSQQEINTISEWKNTVKGIKNSLNETGPNK